MKKNVIFLLITIMLASSLSCSLFKKRIKPQEFTEYIKTNAARELVVTIDGQTGLWNVEIITVLNLESLETELHPDFDREIIELIKSKKIPVSYRRPGNNSWFYLVIIGVIIFFILTTNSRKRSGGIIEKETKLSNFTSMKTNDRVPKNTFNDIEGYQEVKEELREIIDFFRDPKKFTRLGARLPKGILLVGPPGTGKTLLTRAVAGEAKVNFFSISGSEFVEMYVGVGAGRVRDLFQEKAKKNLPCIVFIDEIDAVGKHRGTGIGNSNDEREQTLNQILNEMDGFEVTKGMIVIAATNRPDVLDPALLRPGRFDRHITVPLPDLNERTAILKGHAKKTPLADDVDFKKIAQGTPGCSGADLANIVNEAALWAAKQNKEKIDHDDFEKVKDRILLGGRPKKSMHISKREKERIAYHEAGHALTAGIIHMIAPNETDPLYKITIIPTGQALGITFQLPDEDKLNYSKEELLNKIRILLAGQTAEKIKFKQISTGARNDLERATEIARKMVTRFGMSQVIGARTCGNAANEPFLGKQIIEEKNYSEYTAQLIDQEVKEITFKALERAEKIIFSNMTVLEVLAQKLLEKEILEEKEIKEILENNVPREKRNGVFYQTHKNKNE